MPTSNIKYILILSQWLKRFAKRLNIDFLLTVTALLLGIYLNWSFEDILIFCMAIYLILRPVSNQVMVSGVLLLLAIVTLLTVFGRVGLASEFAIIIFYYLCLCFMTVILQLSDRNIKIRLNRKNSH